MGHLHWRVLNGNLPTHHEPAVTVLLVGINDLLVGETCWPENAEAIEAIGNATALGLARSFMAHIASGMFVSAASASDPVSLQDTVSELVSSKCNACLTPSAGTSCSRCARS